MIKVSENEYVPLATLNNQDLEDVREIKAYHQMADMRTKEGVTKDEEFLLEDPLYLLPHEIEQLNKKRFEDFTSDYFILGDNESDCKELNGRKITIDDDYVTVEREAETGMYYVYLRLPVYDLEGIKRGLR